MYTSGSTGKPKGVMIRHGAMLAEVAGVVHHFAPVILLGKEVFAAFLPLAHILALVAEQSQLAVGAAIGYCDPRTLTLSGSEPVGALAEFKPTIMAAVPKIWDIIKKGAEAKAKLGGGLKHYIFQTAVTTKIALRKLKMDTPLFNALVFKKIGEITGGRLKIAISGGGPLDRSLSFVLPPSQPLPHPSTQALWSWISDGAEEMRDGAEEMRDERRDGAEESLS